MHLQRREQGTKGNEEGLYSLGTVLMPYVALPYHAPRSYCKVARLAWVSTGIAPAPLTPFLLALTASSKLLSSRASAAFRRWSSSSSSLDTRPYRNRLFVVKRIEQVLTSASCFQTKSRSIILDNRPKVRDVGRLLGQNRANAHQHQTVCMRIALRT